MIETIFSVLRIIAAAGTIATGLLALIKPKSIYGFTGLRAEGGRGITEIRAIFGGLFIALGSAALYFRSTDAYQMLGITYLGIFLVRVISMFIDDSVERSNIISLGAEIIFGVILVLPF